MSLDTSSKRATGGNISASARTDRASALEEVRRLLPNIRARAAQTEANRRIPAETISELKAAGLFGLMTPKMFGGTELGFGALVDIAAAIASACGSTGWVYSVLAGHNWMVALYPELAQSEVFGKKDSLTASVFRFSAKVVQVPGGYEMTGGEGRFCSGIDFADWAILGSAVQRENAPAEPMYFLVPKSAIEVVDDWFTMGMRGTGSRTIRVAKAFIPQHRAVLGSEIMQGTTSGAAFHRSAAYSLPFPVALPISLVGPLLGMAQGALEDVVASNAKKLGAMSEEQVGEKGTFFERLARAAADIDAARALVDADCQRLDHLTDASGLSRLDRFRAQRNFAYAVQQCRYAVTRLFEASGGSGIYDGGALQRFFRDINSAAGHTAFAWDDAAPGFSRALLGLPQSRFAGPRRS